MNPLRYLLAILLLVLLAGCSGAPAANSHSIVPTRVAMASTNQAVQPTAPPASSPTMPAPSATPSLAPTLTVPPALLATVTAANCPVTVANGNTPPDEESSAYHHGNGALWTVLWPGGIVRATPDHVQSDGSIDMKFPWWRGSGVQGRLTITGRRLDEPAPPLQADIPEGYGDTNFQASGIIFPTEGCWEVTGKAGGAELTFVTYVVKEKQ